MAYSFRAGTNWCHDFPKLARESGFYFNPHGTRVRVDWNRISTIDIDRVIRDRDFLTVDENVNNVVDYHLESEYDVKILDPNFVKLFRLAQLSVEYLLYCKQYLDRSVIILKDELRSKLEENDTLKKNLLASEENVKGLKDKFRDKYKFIEKRFSDSHGEIHKCPYCPKTFMSAVFMNSHISRRHANGSQLSVSSPVHEQYKAETEKLHIEIKNLKERLNQTERVIRSESVKLSDSIESTKERYNEQKKEQVVKDDDDREKKLEAEHKRYREEISNLTTMLFSEFRNLKQADKKFITQSDTVSDNWKELLRQQENEIQRLRDQLRESSTKKSTVDIDNIQMKLNAQEYWQSKIEQIESQHRADIEKLYTQLKKTEESANRMREDYISRINDLELSRKDVLRSPSKKQAVPAFTERDSPAEILDTVEENYRTVKTDKRRMDQQNEWDAENLIVEDVDKIFDTNISNTFSPQYKSRRITVNTFDQGDNTAVISTNRDSCRKIALKSQAKSIHKGSMENQHISNTRHIKEKDASNEKNVEHKTERVDHKKNVGESLKGSEMDVSSSLSDESDSVSDSMSESEILETEEESNQGNQSDGVNQSGSSQDESESENNRQPYVNIRLKTKEELSREVQQVLKQKLKDLGVDSDWRGIPNATYRQLMDTVKYHRSISSKRFSKFEDTRRKIIQHLTQKISTQQKLIKLDADVAPKKSPLNKLMSNVKTKAFKALSIHAHHESHTPKVKSTSGVTHEKSLTNKLNLELLPKKISQLEFQDIKTLTQHKSRRLRDNRDVRSALSSPLHNMTIHDRYTSSPSRLNTKSSESIDIKQLSHSYESIKDYLKDNTSASRHMRSPFNHSGSMTTSTPQRGQINIVPSDRAFAANISSHISKLDEMLSLPNSPKNNKSVLKSTTGSTASLVKKKVLFDLHTTKDPDEATEQVEVHADISEPNHDKDSGSESDIEISSIFEEKSTENEIIAPSNSEGIVLRTSQSEKIAQISRKIESQLSLSRQKPVGGIEAMFLKEFNIEEEDRMKEHNPTNRSMGFSVKVNTSNEVNKFPQPAPRTPITNLRSLSPDHKSDSKDSNLDLVIEELLRMD